MFRVRYEKFLIERTNETWFREAFCVNSYVEKGKILVVVGNKYLGEFELKQLLKIVEIKNKERIKV